MSAFATWLFDAKRPSWGVLCDMASRRPKTNRMPLQWRQVDTVEGTALSSRMFEATVTEAGSINGFWLYVDNSDDIAYESAMDEGGTDHAEVGDVFTCDLYCGFAILGVPAAYSAPVS